MSKPFCQLSGQDGNVFNIIGLVRKALQAAGREDLAKEWAYRAMHCTSYDEVLALAHEYVEVG